MADLSSITLPDGNTYNFKDGRVSLPLPIASGGTGAATASNALFALGGMPAVFSVPGEVDRAYFDFSDPYGNGNQLGFRQYTSDGSLGNEYYYFPVNTNDEPAEDQYYDIITTKDGSSYFVDLTSSQNITGTKVFKANPRIQNNDPGYRYLNANGDVLGIDYLGVTTVNNVYTAQNKCFRHYSHNSSTGANLSYFEQFALPTVDADRTGNQYYLIWSSKPGGKTTRSLQVSGSEYVIVLKNESAGQIGEIYWSGAKTNNVTHGRWYLGHYSYDSTTGAANGKYEGYYLPMVDADRTANASYDILTTKNLVTVAQGGTGRSDGYSGVWKTISSMPTEKQCSFFVYVSSAITVGDVTIPTYSKGYFTSNGNDAVMQVVDSSYNSYTAFRNGTSWGVRKFQETRYVDKTQSVTFSAGTIGTRAQQYTWTNTTIGGTPIQCQVWGGTISTDFQPLAFIQGTTVYLNIYRCTSSAVSSGRSCVVRIWYA